MITLSVKQAINQGFLVEMFIEDDYVSYEENEHTRIEFKNNSVNSVSVYLDGGCTISCPVGRERLDEHCFNSLRPKLNIYA